MGRREWFIDHGASGFDAAVTVPEVIYDGGIGFHIQPDEDEATDWVTFSAKDAVKLGKALVKAGKRAKEARGS